MRTLRLAARAMPVCALCLYVSPARAQDIAIVGAPLITDPPDACAGIDNNYQLRDLLACTGEFASIDVIDARAQTPTLDRLENYHGVIVFSEVPFADPVLLGDRLADYSDL